MGRSFSHSFGYGIMDASGMVDLAQNWTNVPEQEIYAVKANIGKFLFLFRQYTSPTRDRIPS